MKNNNSGGGRWFSGWTAPQNPLITLLRRRRESKTSNQPERSSGVSFKTVNETHKQQKQQNHDQQNMQTATVTITSSSSSALKSNGSTLQDASYDTSMKKVASGFQPMRIEEYEPGHSSIAIQEKIMEPTDYNPPICKPGELCRYSESKESKHFRIRKKADAANSSRTGFSNNTKITDASSLSSSSGITANRVEATEVNSDLDRHHVYKNVLEGGPIPEEGLWNLIEPRKVKTHPTMTKSLTWLQNGGSNRDLNDSSVERIFEDEVMNRLERPKTREEFEEEMKTRKKKMERVIALEKLKRLEEEKKLNAARRHNDNFLPIEKSPVKLNRYDDEDNADGTLGRGKSTKKLAAVAMYNFRAKSNRELGLRKGDVVNVIRQIDKNWFEGERGGHVGIFPVSYVKIHVNPTQSDVREPALKGVVLFDFKAKSPPELSLYKGERVTIVGAIDDNWVEGRSRNGEGIFPLNFVDLLEDDDASQVSSVYGTPLPSRTATPSFDQRNAFSRLSLRGPRDSSRVVSPVGSIASSYAPTVPSVPISPYGSQDLDTTLGGGGDWPTLEASLLDLEKVSVNQWMQQQEQRDKQGRAGGLERGGSQRMKSHLDRKSLQDYRQEIQKHDRQLLRLQQESKDSSYKSAQRYDHANRAQTKSYSPYNSPQLNLLSKSAHPDLCGGGTSKGSSPVKVPITRSLTNAGLPERSQGYYGYTQSPYNRYPSLISKDNVAVRNEVGVKQMMAKQSEAVAQEFLSRHTSNSSIMRGSTSSITSATPLTRHSLPTFDRSSSRNVTIGVTPVARTSMCFSRDSVSTIRDGGPKTKDSGYEEEVFSFREIKLNPKLPVDYSKQSYTIQTRTSLPGGKPSWKVDPVSPKQTGTLGRHRPAPPMKNYEWHKVLFNHEPKRSDEIKLIKGDLVQVLEKCADGWWLGICQKTGKLGLFPGNYVIPS